MIAEFTALVHAYRYWAIFPIALFEAPLISIVIGFFAAIGDLNLPLAFGVVVFGDFIGDTVLYFFGRWCGPLFGKIGFRLDISGHVPKLREYFGKRDGRAIVISKLVHGVGFTGLIVAGSVRVPYHRFILTCVMVTIVQSATLFAVGMLSGRAYQTFAQYLGYFDIIAAAAFPLVVYVSYRLLVRKLSE